MLFNSLQFLIFFPIVTIAYFALPLRGRWFLLLAASCLFYMAFIPAYIVILLGTIVVDYLAGILIAGSTGRTRKAFLLASIVANVGVLSTFKYWNFFSSNVAYLLRLLGFSGHPPLLSLVLPIGLSFHTFQAMSYTIEVFRGRQQPERNFIVYALYVMFYPQLVAGPIERPQNILHQLRTNHPFDPKRAAVGFRFILWGFFKKCVIADRLAQTVNVVYATPRLYSGPILALATIAFAIQIYSDFSGYSDIAIGCAEVMGIKLMDNFRQPYCSRSVSEFWSRWHISLSTWFRDYVYIPLGGNRTTAGRCYANLFITFLLSGLWHGASWTYVAWGALNGVFLMAERALGSAPRAAMGEGVAHPRLRVLLTFALITTTWIFFRASSLSDALFVLRTIFTDFGQLAHPSQLSVMVAAVFLGRRSLLVTASVIMILLVADRAAYARSVHVADLVGRWRTRQRWIAYYCLAAFLISFGVFGHQQFIYFQF